MNNCSDFFFFFLNHHLKAAPLGEFSGLNVQLEATRLMVMRMKKPELIASAPNGQNHRLISISDRNVFAFLGPDP